MAYLPACYQEMKHEVGGGRTEGVQELVRIPHDGIFACVFVNVAPT